MLCPAVPYKDLLQLSTFKAAQKTKFSITDIFSKCDQIRKKLRILVTFTVEIPNRKFHFLSSVTTLSSGLVPVNAN